MFKRILFIGGAFLGTALMVSPALGVRNPASKAGKFQSNVVQGVEACTVANTKAPGLLGTPACDPVVPSDAVCVFGVKGSGKVQAKAKTDISISAKLGGLEASCDGETLCAVASVRTSQNNCVPGANCSTISQINLPLGVACCVVASGKCQIKTTVNTALPGALVTGNAAEFTLAEIGLVRSGGGVAFKTGLLLP